MFDYQQRPQTEEYVQGWELIFWRGKKKKGSSKGFKESCQEEGQGREDTSTQEGTQSK